MNDSGPGSRVLLDVRRHGVADRDHPGRLPDDRGGLFILMPARGTKWIPLRRVGEIDQTIRGCMTRFAKKDVAEIFGRHQHPVRLEFANLVREYVRPSGQPLDGMNFDACVVDDGRVGDRVISGRTNHPAGMTRAGEVGQPDQVASRRTALWWRIRRVRRQQDFHPALAESSEASSARASSSDMPSISASNAAYSSGSMPPSCAVSMRAARPASVSVPE